MPKLTWSTAQRPRKLRQEQRAQGDFASSGATFGDPERFPITDETPQHPTSPYGITKMVAEHYLRFFQKEKRARLHGAALRQRLRTRPGSERRTGVSRSSSQVSASRRDPDRLDGEQTRDYLYVRDVAAANVSALTRARAAVT